MASPFPGMDPYLERFWGDVHSRLVTYACDQIQERLPVDLIAEEYEVRQHYGEHPSHGEYTARFVHHGAKLRETLGRIDAKLAAEHHIERLWPGTSRFIAKLQAGDLPANAGLPLVFVADELRK